MAVELAIGAVGVGMHLLANLLMKPKDKTPVIDDKPTTLSTRGSYIPWLCGTRRLGPVFCYVGGRSTTKEKAGSGGKGLFGGDEPKQVIYHEQGLHALCVGPAFKLHRIYQGGKVIFEGPIDSTTHPSGSTVDLGKEGSFEIWWGIGPSDAGWGALNTWSTLNTAIGIDSKWPYLCAVLWNKKRLGTAAQWPLIEYVIETRPTNSVLSDTSAYMVPEQIAGSTVYPVTDSNDGAPGVGYFKVEGDVTPYFKPGNEVDWDPDSGTNSDITVRDTDTAQEVDYVNGDITVYKTITTIYFDETLSGTSSDDTLNPYEVSAGFGVNPAHAMAEVLFADYPRGLALDQDDWDLDALEALGTLCSAPNEDLFSNWIGQNGETAQAILGAGMQDLGVMAPFDMDSGKLTFRPVREPQVGETQTLDEKQITSPLTEREVDHGVKRADKLIFTFSDQAYNYRDNTIAIDEDGQGSYLEYQNGRKVDITIATNFEVASRIAERRSQEELAGNNVYTINANREARLLLPGDVIVHPDINEVLRVTEINAQPTESKTKVKAVADFYGVPLSDFSNTEGGGESDFDPVAADLAINFVEVPEVAAPGAGKMAAWVPKIRAHDQIVGSGIHLSTDDVAYEYQLNETNIHAGGSLIDAIEANDPYYQAQGPTFTALGDDIATVEDLSTGAANKLLWERGKQIAVIGREAFFVRNITALGGTTYRLDGLIRARWDTDAEAHASGDSVIIFQYDEVEWLDSLLFSPDVDLYVKATAYSGGGEITLDAAPKLKISTTQGKGLVPMRCPAIWVTSPFLCSPAFYTGNDISVKWSYRTLSGAGQQGYGQSHVSEDVDGSYILRITDGADIVKRVEALDADTTTYTYDNADMVSDFSGEPTTLKFKIYVYRGSYESEATSITVTRES